MFKHKRSDALLTPGLNLPGHQVPLAHAPGCFDGLGSRRSGETYVGSWSDGPKYATSAPACAALLTFRLAANAWQKLRKDLRD